MTLLFTILVFLIILKMTGFLLNIFGKLIGFAFGLVGYMLLAAILISVFGVVIYAVPLLLLAGLVALIVLIVKSATKTA